MKFIIIIKDENISFKFLFNIIFADYVSYITLLHFSSFLTSNSRQQSKEEST